MPPRRRSRSSGRRTSRKRTLWENLTLSHAHGVAGEAVVTDITPEPMGTDLVGTAKILRCIIELGYSKDGASVSNTIQRVGVGITIMTNDGFASLAVPDPLADFQQSWYYWTALTNVFSSTGVNPLVRLADIRTSRLLRSGFKLVLISQSLSTNDVDSSVQISMRNLWEVD